MATTALTLDEIYALAHDAMTANGCNDENASALASADAFSSLQPFAVIASWASA